MERHENPSQEQFMFFLQRQSETIDDRPKNFKQFSDPIKPFSFIDKLEEDVVN